jgi:hypothetical protein
MAFTNSITTFLYLLVPFLLGGVRIIQQFALRFPASYGKYIDVTDDDVALFRGEARRFGAVALIDELLKMGPDFCVIAIAMDVAYMAFSPLGSEFSATYALQRASMLMIFHMLGLLVTTALSLVARGALKLTMLSSMIGLASYFSTYVIFFGIRH